MHRVFLSVLALFVFQASTEDLPSFIHVCQKSDPNLIQCLMAAVEDVRPFFVDGVPEYNIPKLEPLIMKDFFSEEAAGMKITVSDVSAWGCSDYLVRSMEVDMDNHHFIVNIEIPKLRIEAHYNVDGKLVVMPIKGDGHIEINITDVTARSELMGVQFEKDGQNHLRFDKFDIEVKVGGGMARVENLFNGDKVLLGMVNDVVNKNFDMFLRELLPIIQRQLGVVFKEAANAIVERFAYEQLFP
ncbi:circadian clock-controlled protein daywake-like [Diabrotica virgifera virgifera]|uniref:Circadian clock-controlled protein-like n=2 Tax=Diabrotica virgifera virgifera TaxID=50390 RepID=A0ABM5JKG2_DIAVI|nr:circadian clock-controlled protein daywake-like [Diabrotica virgifera virgifera]